MLTLLFLECPSTAKELETFDSEETNFTSTTTLRRFNCEVSNFYGARNLCAKLNGNLPELQNSEKRFNLDSLLNKAQDPGSCWLGLVEVFNPNCTKYCGLDERRDCFRWASGSADNKNNACNSKLSCIRQRHVLLESVFVARLFWSPSTLSRIQVWRNHLLPPCKCVETLSMPNYMLFTLTLHLQCYFTFFINFRFLSASIDILVLSVAKVASQIYNLRKNIHCSSSCTCLDDNFTFNYLHMH